MSIQTMETKNKVSPKEKILAVAQELFHKQGYRATGVNQIIAEAGVAKASLYHYFPTKDDLCYAYIEERHHIWMKDFKIFLKYKKNKVMAAFDFIIITNENNDYRGCPFINMVSETSAENIKIYQALQRHKLDLQFFFNTLISSQESQLAYHIYALFENAIVESQLFRSQEPVIRTQKIVSTLLSDKYIVAKTQSSECPI